MAAGVFVGVHKKSLEKAFYKCWSSGICGHFYSQVCPSIWSSPAALLVLSSSAVAAAPAPGMSLQAPGTGDHRPRGVSEPPMRERCHGGQLWGGAGGGLRGE